MLILPLKTILIPYYNSQERRHRGLRRFCGLLPECHKV